MSETSTNSSSRHYPRFFRAAFYNLDLDLKIFLDYSKFKFITNFNQESHVFTEFNIKYLVFNSIINCNPTENENFNFNS